MSDETIWVTISGNPAEEELAMVRDAFADVYPDRRVIVTTDDIDTVDAEHAERIAERLIDALRGGEAVDE